MAELREVLASMEAKHIALPLSEAIVCTFNDAVSPLVSLLKSRDFDSCPVLEGDLPVGVFSRLKEPVSIEAGTSLITVGHLISGDTPILELAKKLIEHEFIFVLSGSRITGFITAADLGSIAARSYCYLQLASVEIGLSKYLRSRFPDQAAALNFLTSSRQMLHMALVDNLKRLDQYIDDIAACSLEDLLRIAGKDEVFRAELPKFPGWQRLKSGLSDFRNDVMHPSRPILSAERRSVVQFVEKIENLQTISRALDNLNITYDGEVRRPE